nr:hypothetical protein [Acidiferrobacterales bacterium]
MNSFPLKLVSINPTLIAKDGFHAHPRDIKEVKVAFTKADEEQVATQLSGLNDTSCFSEEIESITASGEFINTLRSQSLLAFDFTGIRTCLEISNDYGNLCRFLAENTEVVESLKVNTNAARSSAYRCADLTNLGIVNAEISNVDIPENYYDLVVISDIETICRDVREIELVLK